MSPALAALLVALAPLPQRTARATSQEREGGRPPCSRDAEVATLTVLVDTSTHGGGYTPGGNLLVCLGLPAGWSRVGSVHLELTYDTTALRSSGSSFPARAPHAVNDDGHGRIGVAAASAEGMSTGVLLVARLEPRDAGAALESVRRALAGVRMRLVELSSTDGVDLLPKLIVGTEPRFTGGQAEDDAPAEASAIAETPSPRSPTRAEVRRVAGRCRASQRAPQLLLIAPEPVAVPPGGQVRLALLGCHFSRLHNSVMIGMNSLPNVPSTANGTRLDVAFPIRPTEHPEAPPRPVAPGSYRVRISTAVGTSAPRLLRVTP